MAATRRSSRLASKRAEPEEVVDTPKRSARGKSKTPAKKSTTSKSTTRGKSTSKAPAKKTTKTKKQASPSPSPEPVKKRTTKSKATSKTKKSTTTTKKSRTKAATKSADKGRKRVKAAEMVEEVEEEEEEEEEEEVAPKKKAATKKAPRGKAYTSAAPVGARTSKGKWGDYGKEITDKVSCEVDDQCPKVGSCKVLHHEGKLYDAMLNQTNLARNNNKYYLIQTLVEKAGTRYYCWNRWGRVGETTGTKLWGPFHDVDAAIDCFNKKWRDKAVRGEYVALAKGYEDEAKGARAVDVAAAKKSAKVPMSVANFVELIFDKSAMANTLKSIGYDAKKTPLGSLGKDTINDGYSVLRKISDVIEGKKKGNLTTLTSEFFTLIPHDVGRSKMHHYLINSAEKLEKKLEMINSLREMQVANKILNESGDEVDNAIDHYYKKLNCKIQPVAASSDEYDVVNRYMKNTHASTHRNYKLELLDLFKVDRGDEAKKFKKNLGNRMLLWHGSRLSNYVGILSQGLRIAPPEAPVTGYMFGKGVYFADMVSKSANYCCTSRDSNTGILILCDVALGECNEKKRADFYADRLPKGKSSTKGVGKTAPSEDSYVKLGKDIQVPVGKGEDTNIDDCSLMYNEYIVYDINQIQMKYLLKCKFKYT
mmetsp:Transcript_52481/g.60021  ORF Transcript_52481/g.60021 Transcript_52481/m.60021 type:complete len:650 (-) Transcript_52481:186-2135(-)